MQFIVVASLSLSLGLVTVTIKKKYYTSVSAVTCMIPVHLWGSNHGHSVNSGVEFLLMIINLTLISYIHVQCIRISVVCGVDCQFAN